MRTQLRKPTTSSAIASALGRSFEGVDVPVDRVAALSAAAPGALLFRYRGQAEALPAGCTIISMEKHADAAWIVSDGPRLHFVKALQWLDTTIGFALPTTPASVHPTVRMGSNVSLGNGVTIGEGTVLEHNIRIADDVQIGRYCRIKSGTVIGEDGFGFERDLDGTPLRMIHLGGVRIGDRVELGSLNTVCQGALAPTVIEDDVKTDDHVHIAHNCWIKRKALLTACVELSGGVTVGEGAWIGPNVSVIDGGRIGDHAFVGIGAAVIREVRAGATVVGNPARELEKK